MSDRRHLGTVSDDESMAALRCAAELGVNFFDTADVDDEPAAATGP